ncbi:MAG: aminopeptidase [Prevotella sp.]|nr:aminopeptidase [Prevotella sp.]
MRRPIGLICFLLLALTVTAGEDISARLKALPGISGVEPLENEIYEQKYVMYIDQQTDPKDPEAGTFRQRVILCHVGFDRPTIIVTEGYFAEYALRPKYQDELSRLFNANVICVEYRYFGKSFPEPCNWDYLTVENSLCDLHHVNRTFRQLYPGKWIATGISKGGQTTMFYRVFYPDDVDVSVPYVAPLNKSLEDGRHEPFIGKEVSTPENRRHVQDFQLEVLKRKARLMPLFRKHCEEKGYTFRVPLEEIYDYVVLEYSFAVWQWGTPMEKIPGTQATDEELFKSLIALCEPDYFSEQTIYTSFNVQAARELGYYGYDTKPFRKYLSIKTAKDYMHRVMLAEQFKNLKFDKTLYKKTRRFLKKNDPSMIYIYGGIDPWGASGVAGLKFLKKKKNLKVYVYPEGSHATRISTFPEPRRTEIINSIRQWIQ